MPDSIHPEDIKETLMLINAKVLCDWRIGTVIAFLEPETKLTLRKGSASRVGAFIRRRSQAHTCRRH